MGKRESDREIRSEGLVGKIEMVEERTAEKTKRGVTINIGQEALTYEKKKKRSVPERPRLVRMHIVWLYNADMLPPVSVCAEHFA